MSDEELRDTIAVLARDVRLIHERIDALERNLTERIDTIEAAVREKGGLL